VKTKKVPNIDGGLVKSHKLKVKVAANAGGGWRKEWKWTTSGDQWLTAGVAGSGKDNALQRVVFFR
jgi:hypothetical protein